MTFAMRNLAAVCLALTASIGLAGCEETPTAVPSLESVPDPLFERIDATSDGDLHFFFIQPLAVFNGGFAPFEPRALEDLTALLISPDWPDPLSLPIVRNTNKQFFEARWDAPLDAPPAKVEVWLAEKLLGSLDLQPASNIEEERAARAAGNAFFEPGRLVQIRFKVEVGAGEGQFPDGPRMLDGRSPDGDSRLFFIPPATQDRVEGGVFDPDRADELAVEVWGLSHGERDFLAERFEASSSDLRKRVQVNRNREFYQVTWPTYGVKSWIDYRAYVYLGESELGWLDVDVVPFDSRFKDILAKEARRTGAYAVTLGREAFIRFRVEKELAPAMGTFAYVSNDRSQTVTQVDVGAARTLRHIPVGGPPTKVLIAPSGDHAYVAVGGGDKVRGVAVIPTSRNAVVARVRTEWVPTDLAISPDGRTVYVAVPQQDQVLVIEAGHNEVVATIDLHRPGTVDLTPDGEILYVGQSNELATRVVRTDTRELQTTLPHRFREIVFLPDGSSAYGVLLDEKVVGVLDRTSHTVTTTIPVGTDPWDLAVSPDGSEVYVVNANSNSVSVIETGANTVVATIPVGRFPNAVAFTPDGTLALVTNIAPNTLTAIRTENRSVVWTTGVGINPEDVAVTSR